MCLVIDEADAILKIGFQEELNQILNILPKKRQSILFSATQTKKIEELARLSLNSPIYIGNLYYPFTLSIKIFFFLNYLLAFRC